MELLKSVLFQKLFGRGFLRIGASNWLEPVAQIFLNRLADFCLVRDNFGGRWNSRPPGAREIMGTE